MLTTYEIQGPPDVGSAIAVAHRRGIADGFPRVSIVATQQIGRTSWLITCFVSV